MALKVSDSFSGQSVLLTGVTGFMGKVMLEKLLRACPGIRHIYILSREKRGKSVHQRFEKIFATKLYSVLESENPKFREKLTIIDSDLTQPNLGLSAQDKEIICNEVNIVFHLAANVKFNEPIQIVYNLNVRGTKHILLLTKEFKCLKAFVYVSTAYSNFRGGKIEEKVYEPPIPYNILESIVDNIDARLLKELEHKLLGKWANTYVYSKAVAEDLVRDLGKGMPVAIVRPGIVLSSRYDPIPGWIDNVNGHNGMIAGAYTGVIRTARINPDLLNGFVPVDMADNLIITAAAQLVQEGSKEDTKVYNYVSSPENSFTGTSIQTFFKEVGHLYPTINCLWIPFMVTTESRFLYIFLWFFLHILPGLVFNSIVWLSGKKVLPMSMLSIYQKVDKYTEIANFSCFNIWDWDTTNSRKLWKIMTKEDQMKFKFDIVSLDWKEYFIIGVLGIRQYLLKDDLSTLPRAVVKYKWLKWAHYTILLFLTLSLLQLTYMITPFLVRFSTTLYS